MVPLPSPPREQTSTLLRDSVSMTPNARKRQRGSMSSSGGSSPKRATSELLDSDDHIHPNSLNASASRPSPDTPGDSKMSALSLDQDIDAYMATQETAPDPGKVTTTPQEMKEAYMRLKSKKMEAGETWYLVSNPWIRMFELQAGTSETQVIPPVNNTSLLTPNGELKRSLTEGIEVHYVPAELWNYFEAWFGKADHALSRQTLRRPGGIITLEIHKLRLTYYILSKVSSPSSEIATIDVSAATTANDFVRRLLECADLSPDSGRIWQLNDDTRPQNQHYLVQSLDKNRDSLWPEVSLGAHENPDVRTLDDLAIGSNDAFVIDKRDFDGKWLSDSAPGVPAASSTTMFGSGSGTDFFSSTRFTSGANNSKALTTTRAFGQKDTSSATTHKTRGILGLGNMGNTCFMNSALQCLAHTQDVVEYFLGDVYEIEINRNNPLGMGGAIAEVFGDLVKRLWSRTGPIGSYHPREFKQTLQRFAPQFSGYQQHDSQELIAFLLDGLHEDLNRVVNKPYVENPDWHGGAERELLELAQNSWDGYKRRNDSVIVDLFQGQYQSTLVCPECQKVSITFDPYMYLTLPLPVTRKWQHDVYYVPWNAKQPHVKVPVELNRNATVRDMKKLLGKWMFTNPEHLYSAEVFSHRFFKIFEDSDPVAEIGQNDSIVCFELPVPAHQTKGYQPNENDPLILSVLMQENKQFGWGNFCNPFLIVLSREQTRSVAAMYAAVVERLERWSRHPVELYKWEGTVGFPPAMPSTPVTEIKPDGDTVVAIPEEEGDITDEKFVLVQEDVEMRDEIFGKEDASQEPKSLGPKDDLFQLVTADNNTKNYSSHVEPFDWSQRIRSGSTGANPEHYLKRTDMLVCRWERPQLDFFLAAEPGERPLWDNWEIFENEDIRASRAAAEERKAKVITLDDCLNEFTQEELLGEDDLWYCPQCKKHQQATKKFDIWTVPDILVVHLKRFSSSRYGRDKIDALVDFPIERLNLEGRVRQRTVLQKLISDGVDISDYDVTEPLEYDLFAVDEHLGGLGGGHYRAYAQNHATNSWYHFDDSHVSACRASEAVNSNAYVLFYQRRTSKPLGGLVTRAKIEAARQEAASRRLQGDEVDASAARQLPTPPSEAVTPPRPGYHDLSEVNYRLRNVDEQSDWNRTGSQTGSPSWSIQAYGSGPSDVSESSLSLNVSPLVSQPEPPIPSLESPDFVDLEQREPESGLYDLI